MGSQGVNSGRKPSYGGKAGTDEDGVGELSNACNTPVRGAIRSGSSAQGQRKRQTAMVEGQDGRDIRVMDEGHVMVNQGSRGALAQLECRREERVGAERHLREKGPAEKQEQEQEQVC